MVRLNIMNKAVVVFNAKQFNFKPILHDSVEQVGIYCTPPQRDNSDLLFSITIIVIIDVLPLESYLEDTLFRRYIGFRRENNNQPTCKAFDAF